MKIHIARRRDDLEIRIDELCIVVRGRYRHPFLSSKSHAFPIVDINAVLAISKNLDEGDIVEYTESFQAKMDNNLTQAVTDAINKIPIKKRRRLLNEAINEAWPR